MGTTERSRVPLSLLAEYKITEKMHLQLSRDIDSKVRKRFTKERLESITTASERPATKPTPPSLVSQPDPSACSDEVDRVAAQNNEPILYKVNNYESERTNRSTYKVVAGAADWLSGARVLCGCDDAQR